MSSYNHYQPIASSVWTISHGLNSKFIALDALSSLSEGVYEKIMPQSVTIVNDNIVSIKFPYTISGRARIVAKT